jgi:hypothetical protein
MQGMNRQAAILALQHVQDYFEPVLQDVWILETPKARKM